jgi:hypothetical protein
MFGLCISTHCCNNFQELLSRCGNLASLQEELLTGLIFARD